MNVAAYDGIIACWDAEYTYWAVRPSLLDPSMVWLFPNPGHPSYTAAHSIFDGPYGTMLGYLFPRDADYFTAQAQEAGTARRWAGIHFRSDIEMGLEIGRRVGHQVIAWAKNDARSKRRCSRLRIALSLQYLSPYHCPNFLACIPRIPLATVSGIQ